MVEKKKDNKRHVRPFSDALMCTREVRAVAGQQQLRTLATERLEFLAVGIMEKLCSRVVFFFLGILIPVRVFIFNSFLK